MTAEHFVKAGACTRSTKIMVSIVRFGECRSYHLLAAVTLASTLVLAAPAYAGTRPVTVASEPSGANVEWNGHLVGTTPFTVNLEDYCFKSPKWLWSKYMNEAIVLRVWKDAYMEKTLTLTSGPYSWVSLDGRYTKIYYVVTSEAFHVRLQAFPYLPKPPTTDTGTGATVPEGPESVMGTGFVLPRSAYVVTNHHVVNGMAEIMVMSPSSQRSTKATVAVKDQTNDLAILKMEDASVLAANAPNSLFSVGSSPLKIGQEVFTLGFPLGDIMGATARLSSGRIDSLLGLQDDPRVYQISNPLQPGNSGGPLFNANGELVGIVFSGLNAKLFYEAAGIIPQNVNFAIKATYLKNLLEVLPDAPTFGEQKNALAGLSMERLIEVVSPLIVRVSCKRVSTLPAQSSEPIEPTGRTPSATATASAPPASSSSRVPPEPTPEPRVSTGPSGRLRVLTDPGGADVYIGNLRLGTTTSEGILLELPAGSVTISVRKLGYSSVERTLTVGSNSDFVLPITLHTSPQK